jgi:hypothetical protein
MALILALKADSVDATAPGGPRGVRWPWGDGRGGKPPFASSGEVGNVAEAPIAELGVQSKSGLYERLQWGKADLRDASVLGVSVRRDVVAAEFGEASSTSTCRAIWRVAAAGIVSSNAPASKE